MAIEFTMSGFAVRINGEIVADSLPSEEKNEIEKIVT